jgi:hypothetical protein
MAEFLNVPLIDSDEQAELLKTLPAAEPASGVHTMESLYGTNKVPIAREVSVRPEKLVLRVRSLRWHLALVFAGVGLSGLIIALVQFFFSRAGMAGDLRYLAVAALALALAVILGVGRTSATFDKKKKAVFGYGRFNFEGGTLLPRNPERVLDLDEVAAIRLVKKHSTRKRHSKEEQERALWEVQLVMSADCKCDYALSLDPDERRAREIAGQIAKFLAIELVDETGGKA